MHIRNLQSWITEVAEGLEKDPNYLKLNEHREKLLEVRNSHYTFTATLKQIGFFLLGDRQSDLVCQRHPLGKQIHPDPGS